MQDNFSANSSLLKKTSSGGGTSSSSIVSHSSGGPAQPPGFRRGGGGGEVEKDGGEGSSSTLLRSTYNSSSDDMYKEQLYRRLDEGIAATLATHSRRWDGGATGQDEQEKGGSSSIFEKYRDNLVGSGVSALERSGGGGGRTLSSSPGLTSSSGSGGGGQHSKGTEKEKQHLQLRSTAAKRGTGITTTGTAHSSSVVSPTKADINSLLSSDAERFMEYTMSNPPQHQLLQLRVLEMFQVWISAPSVAAEIAHLLEESRQSIGGAGETRVAWGEETRPADPQKNTGAGQPGEGSGKDCGGTRGAASSSGATGGQGGSVEAERNRSRSPEALRPTPPSSSCSGLEIDRVRGNLLNPTPEKVVPEGEDDALVVALTVKSLSEHSSNERSMTTPPCKQEGASYDEIPRFYFPLGKPTTREKIISEPLYKHHENPHLRPPQEGMTLATMEDGCSSRSSSRGMSSSSSSSSSSKGGGGGTPTKSSRVPPMSTLRFADDRHVSSYIKKEFARLNAPSRHQKNRMSSSRRSTSGSKESQVRNHFHQCMQRICSQCFGVPRYFGFIIIGLIQAELSTSEEYSHLTGSVKGGLPFISPQVYSTITAEHVHEFYEKYLKNKDTLRRTFDLLILSSRLSQTSEELQKESAGPADPTSLRAHLIAEDFKTYLMCLLSHHPGLAFLRQTPDFQNKYLDTVIYRIFYEIDRFDRGRISFPEFIGSALMDAFRQVDATDDINSVLTFFSYEHFYVLYCRFWELDDDRDMLLSAQDLMRYSPDDTMNPLVVQRIFAGAGRRIRCTVKNRIGYEDFVWYCLSEEDKSTPTAIRYWFKVLDVDEDGVLSPYEIRTFYDATTAKAAQYLQDNTVSFENVICQVFDMLRCQEYRWLTLSDFMGEPVASYVALNMMTSLIKFLQFEYKDPFVSHQERQAGGVEQSPWDRFARSEYDRMAQEGDD